jgi:hypothetical protein
MTAFRLREAASEFFDQRFGAPVDLLSREQVADMLGSGR